MRAERLEARQVIHHAADRVAGARDAACKTAARIRRKWLDVIPELVRSVAELVGRASEEFRGAAGRARRLQRGATKRALLAPRSCRYRFTPSNAPRKLRRKGVREEDEQAPAS